MALLSAKWAEGKFACGGFDPDPEKLPVYLKSTITGHESLLIAVQMFLLDIAASSADIVCAWKLNSAFFEGLGGGGLEMLADTIRRLKEIDSTIPIVVDGKRGDIGNTNVGYRKAAFDWQGADAITANPYMGLEQGIEALLEDPDRGVLLLCRTSNKGACEFQDHGKDTAAGPLYMKVARHVAEKWNTRGNCGIVVGATSPTELFDIRRAVGDLPILIPGIGAQGGDLDRAIAAGHDSKGQGMILNNSRAFLYASSGTDFADAARRAMLKMHLSIRELQRQAQQSMESIA